MHGHRRAGGAGPAVFLLLTTVLLVLLSQDAAAVRLGLQPGTDRAVLISSLAQDASGKLNRIAQNSKFRGSSTELLNLLQRDQDLVGRGGDSWCVGLV